MDLDENTLKSMFAQSTLGKDAGGDEKVKFTEEESSKFQKAFEDPEFRKLFSEYVDEMQDPANRQETEDYISQLEGENKVPQGKELIRPSGAFVAKTYKTHEVQGTETKDKVFLNIVYSDKIAVPTKTTSKEGTYWSVPYSLGPPHMEKDKTGDNVACFDCCFHSEAIKLSTAHKEFKELIVHTGMDGIEDAFKRQGQNVKLDKNFHTLKGVTYKQGQIPTMMLDTGSKDKWADKDADLLPTPPASTTAPTEPNNAVKSPAKKSASAIKKGFLNNAKTNVYPETVKAKNKVPASEPSANPILLPSQVQELPSDAGASTLQTSSTAAKPLVTELSASEIESAKKRKDERKEGGAAPTASKQIPSASNTDNDVLKPVSTVMKSKGEAASGGPTTPKFTMKERGNVSMGDFQLDSVKTSASSLRPNELVFKIEVPLVQKASQIVVDMTERELQLSYLDVYKLHVDLPYPVFDTKGTAKYDKTAKVLTLTMPVKPPVARAATEAKTAPIAPAPVTELAPKSGGEGKEEGEGEGEAEDSSDQSKDGSSSPAKPSPLKGSNGSKHNRWVADPIAAGKDSVEDPTLDDKEKARLKVLAESTSLREEIQRKAKEAREEALASLADPSKAKAKAQATLKTDTQAAAAVEAGQEGESGLPFSACSQFSGARAGYCFQTGGQGLGYYLDAKQGPPPPAKDASTSNGVKKSAPAPSPEAKETAAGAAAAASSSSSSSSASKPAALSSSPVVPVPEDLDAFALSLRKFKFETQQTRPAVAMLVQVPHIIKESVKVRFQKHAVDIYFEAYRDEGSTGGGGEKDTYGGGFDLPVEFCPSGLNIEESKFDVANWNMVVVLTKAVSEYWDKAGGSQSSRKNMPDMVPIPFSLLQARDYHRESKSKESSDSDSGSEGAGSNAGSSNAVSEKTVSEKTEDKSSIKKESRVESTPASLKAYEESVKSLDFGTKDLLFDLD